MPGKTAKVTFTERQHDLLDTIRKVYATPKEIVDRVSALTK